MIATMGLLEDSWNSLLNGSLTYSGKAVKVYNPDAPEDLDPSPSVSEHYVIVRAESETEVSNKKTYAMNSIVVVDIVTVFQNNINRTVAEDIYGQIVGLVFSKPGRNQLAVQTGIQILEVRVDGTFYRDESGDQKIRRKICRFSHRISS